MEAQDFARLCVMKYYISQSKLTYFERNRVNLSFIYLFPSWWVSLSRHLFSLLISFNYFLLQEIYAAMISKVVQLFLTYLKLMLLIIISVATVAQTVDTVAQYSLDNPIGTQALTGAWKLRTNLRQHE